MADLLSSFIVVGCTSEICRSISIIWIYCAALAAETAETNLAFVDDPAQDIWVPDL